MGDDFSKAFAEWTEWADRYNAKQATCLKRAVQVLHQIATAESNDGVRAAANKALQEIAVTLTC